MEFKSDKSTPDRIRTCGLQLRRLLLYPAELPGHTFLIHLNRQAKITLII